MRIASSQYQATMLQSLQVNQERLSYLTQQMAARQRIMLPSDDPVDSVRMSRLRREEAAMSQYIENIAAVKIRMTKNENLLSSMVNDMIPGRDLLVWASDGSNTSADLNAMVTPLSSLRDSLLYTANAIDQEGNYIFSGTLTATAPIDFNPGNLAGSRYTYVGNNKNQTVVVGDGINEVANTNIEGIEAMLNQLDLAIDTMDAPGANPNNPTVRTVLSDTLVSFDDALELVSGKIAKLGGTQNILSTLDINHSNVSLSNKMALTDIGQLDYGVAATELEGYSTALQATYKAYGKIGELSLFSII